MLALPLLLCSVCNDKRGVTFDRHRNCAEFRGPRPLLRQLAECRWTTQGQGGRASIQERAFKSVAPRRRANAIDQWRRSTALLPEIRAPSSVSGWTEPNSMGRPRGHVWAYNCT